MWAAIDVEINVHALARAGHHPLAGGQAAAAEVHDLGRRRRAAVSNPYVVKVATTIRPSVVYLHSKLHMAKVLF